MNNNGNNNSSGNEVRQHSEINLNEFIALLGRRKRTIIISLALMLTLALLYNFFSTPIYQATVTLKKDVINNKSGADEFKQMFQMQTADELDTEIQIIKTRTVLEKIISELKLLVQINRIEFVNGKINEYNVPWFIYDTQTENPLTISNINFDIDRPMETREYFIQVTQPNLLDLYDVDSEELVQSVNYNSQAHLSFGAIQFDLKWPHRKTGDRFYLQIKNFQSVLKKLQNDISVSKIEKTNIFNVSCVSPYPQATRIIANTVVETYRENRLAQKRQSIHTSFDFVDNQLQEISEKLKEAEFKLGQFKSENKITTMAESSTEILNFLSNLETEKVEIELQLAEYSDKLKGMNLEQEKKGFVDQTYLAPNGDSDRGSPFSVLLTQLSDAEIKRLELIQKRKETHPEVIAIDKQIAQIKSRLSEYNQNTMSSYEIIINTLRQKRYNLQSLIDKYSSKLESLPGQETTLVELMRDKNAYEKMYTLLLDKREELRMAEFSKFQDIIVVDPAKLPFKPIAPRTTLNIIVSIFLGLIIGVIAVFIQGFFEVKVNDIDEFEAEFSLPILAVIPQFTREVENTINNAKNVSDRLVTMFDDQSEYLESYRLLRTRLFNLSQSKIKSYLFTSGEPDTGKSTIVANLGISLAMAGKKVLLIDCDLKKAGLSKIYNIPQLFPDYLEYLRGNGDYPVPFKPFKKSNNDLDINILKADFKYVENSSELFESPKMKTLLKKAQTTYDFVLIDTPPVTQVVDTLILGSYVQNVIYVAKPSHTYKDSVKFAFEEMKQSSVKICGIVVNGGNINRSSYRYKYGYKYGYGFKG